MPDRRIAGDAPRVRRWPHDAPLSAALLGDLDDRHAVRGLRLLRLLLVPVGDSVGEEQYVVRVLVVLDEQATRRAVDREVHDAVVVHPPLPLLLERGVARVRLELRAVGDRVAPGDEDARGVTLGHDDRIRRRYRDAFEPEQLFSLAGLSRACAGTAFRSEPMPPAPATTVAARPPPTTLRRDKRADTTYAKVSLSESLLTKSSSTLAMAGVLERGLCQLMRRPGAGRAWRDARGALFRFDEETLTVLC